MQVLLSLLSFSDWFRDDPRLLSHYLVEKWHHSLDGYELLLDWDELRPFRTGIQTGVPELPRSHHGLDPEATAYIFSSRSLSVHLNDAKYLQPDFAIQALEDVNELMELLPHVTFVFHADNANAQVLDTLLRGVGDPSRLTVENMCPKKNELIALGQVADFLRLYYQATLTFDLCHWVEATQQLGESGLTSFLAEFGRRVRALHLSVPSSCCPLYESADPTNHCLLARSNFLVEPLFAEVIRSVPVETRIVLEGYVPLSCAELVAEEVALVRQMSQRAI